MDGIEYIKTLESPFVSVFAPSEKFIQFYLREVHNLPTRRALI